jgi:hypothetical protein
MVARAEPRDMPVGQSFVSTLAMKEKKNIFTKVESNKKIVITLPLMTHQSEDELPAKAYNLMLSQ